MGGRSDAPKLSRAEAQAARAARDAEIIELRADNTPLRDIAEEFGLTPQRVWQIWHAALKKVPIDTLAQRRHAADLFVDRMVSRLAPLVMIRR